MAPWLEEEDSLQTRMKKEAEAAKV